MLWNRDLCGNTFFDLISFSALSSEHEIREAIYNDIGNANACSEMSKVTEYQLPAPGTCVQRDNFPIGTDKEEDVMRCLALVSRSDLQSQGNECPLLKEGGEENVNNKNKNALVEYLGGLCLVLPPRGSHGSPLGALGACRWDQAVTRPLVTSAVAKQKSFLWQNFSLELFYQKSDTKPVEFGSPLQARNKSWFVSILQSSK